jgi:hypothetical protein
VEAADKKTFAINSTATTDPWRHATGEYLQSNVSSTQPGRCAGGMVRSGTLAGGSWDIDIHFHLARSTGGTISHKGRFAANCNALTMDDGGTYQRVGSTAVAAAAHGQDEAAAGCRVAALTAVSGGGAWSPSAKPGWKQGSPHCRVVQPLICFTPESLTYSGPLFLKRQCD